MLTPHGRLRAAGEGRRPRGGFTFIEILVTLVIVALLAAVLVPAVLGRVRHGEAAAIASTLDALRDGVLEYRGDVRRYPTHLRFLSAVPGSASDICGRTVPDSFLDEWQGPYLDQTITTAGAKVGNALVLDSIVRTPETFTSATTGELTVRIQDVDSAVARQVEGSVDVTSDFTAGTVRWTDAGGGRGILSYAIPVRGC